MFWTSDGVMTPPAIARGKLVLVLPVPRAVGLDDDIQHLIEVVEADARASHRLFQVHVPALELPGRGLPPQDNGMRLAPIEDPKRRVSPPLRCFELPFRLLESQRLAS